MVSCSRSVRKIARATASRGASSSTKRSPWASCSVAPSPRIASVMRKPSRPWMPTTAVGWNWTNSRSASAAPAARASSRPEPNEPGRVGGARPQRGGAAGGEDRAARGERAAVLEPDAGDAAVAEQVRGAGALEDLDRGVLGDVGRELAQDPAAGRAAAGVHDAAGAVAALEAERDVAVAVGVEAHAELLEVAEAGGRLVGQHLGGGAADEAAAGRERVLEVPLRRVVDGERRREAALRPVGRGLGERPGGDERHPRALAGRAQAGEQPGRAGAHDHEVRALGVHGRRTVPAWPPLWLRHDSSLAHDIPGHPERPERIRALEAEMGRARLVRRRAAGGAGGRRASSCEAVHPGRYVAWIEELCASGGGFIDADTVAVAGARWRRRCARRAGRSRSSTRCSAGRRRPACRRCGRPGITPSRDARWASASSATSAVAARAGAVGARPRAGADPRLGRAPRQRDRGDLRRRPAVLFVSIHEWPLYPGTGPASYVGTGAGEGYTVNLPVPGGSGDAVYRSLVEHVVAPLIRAWEPQLVLVSAGFDAHRVDPLATCHGHRGGLRGR